MARGFKTGGRVAGVPNKATVIRRMIEEALETQTGRDAVALAVQKLAQPTAGQKKGLDHLRELAMISHTLVAMHQPRRDERTGNLEVKDHAKLQAYLQIAIRANEAVASFESPKFKAVTVPDIPPPPPDRAGDGDGNVVSSMRKRTPQDAADAYMRLVRGGKAATG